jgi:hypothetical protein
MCSQQASCESSDYTEHVGRMGTTPHVINVREREGALMKRLVSTLDFRIGCHHSHLNSRLSVTTNLIPVGFREQFS